MVDCIVLLSRKARPRRLDDWTRGLVPPPRVAADRAALMDMVRQRPPALIVTSAQIADELRMVAECADLAMLAWTDDAEVDSWAAVEACRADDLISCESEPAEFAVRAARAIARRARRPSEERRRNDRMTGVLTRPGMLAAARDYEAVAQAEGRGLLVLVVEIQDFDRTNAHYGRFVGDELLRRFVNRLSSLTPDSPTIARLGGGRFAVIQWSTDRHETLEELQRVVAALTRPYEVVGENLAVDVSYGVACAPEDGATVDSLVRAAEASIRSADRAAPKPARQGDNARELAHAIGSGDLALYYQPQYLLDGGMLAGVEALLRWPRPGQGNLPPHIFLAAIEDAGILARLARWVLRQASFDIAAWRRHGVAPPRISVNASLREMRSGALSAAVRGLTEEGAWTPGMFDIDVPLAAIEGSSKASAGLDELRELGLALTLDVGRRWQGVSPGSLPDTISTVKFDRLALSADGVVDTIAALRGRKIRIAVGGIENARDAALARQFGCDQAQGHYFGLPASSLALFRATA